MSLEKVASLPNVALARRLLFINLSQLSLSEADWHPIKRGSPRPNGEEEAAVTFHEAKAFIPPYGVQVSGRKIGETSTPNS